MTLSRRSVLAASLEIGGATGLSTLAHAAPRSDPHVTDLIRLSEESNAALLRGDIKTYLDLLSVSRDFTLMSPFGGKPSHGTERALGGDRTLLRERPPRAPACRNRRCESLATHSTAST